MKPIGSRPYVSGRNGRYRWYCLACRRSSPPSSSLAIAADNARGHVVIRHQR